jgi:prepilin-type N-terminal cleavage/methylation domain-containing protein
MKRKQNKGFTLAELLIVVAIIAVLVAISIPIFTSQLEKSREAVDLANLRSAYALGVAKLSSEDKPSNLTNSSAIYVYAPSKGTLELYGIGVKAEGVGKGTRTIGSADNKHTIATGQSGFKYDPGSNGVKDQAIVVTINWSNNTVVVSFANQIS